MPLVHISLLKGKSPAYIRALADGIHQALHETYQVPQDDRFQLIHQYDPGELIYDTNYLGIERTDDIVIAHITASNWRDAAAKDAFYKRAAELLANNPGLRKEDLQIVFSPNQREDWCFGNGVPAYPPITRNS